MAALEADVSPRDVNLTVVGRPPAQTIVPWNEASIGGYRAIDVLPPPALTRLDARLPRLWPPGPVALASAAARMLKVAATRGSDSLIGVVTMTRDEGNGGRAAMLPVTVGVRGITRVLTPSLSTRDRVRLESALQ
jgi:malate/lactate dehydrogenase